jgi:hypothetical protein
MKFNMIVDVASKGRTTEGESSTKTSGVRSFVRRFIRKEPCICVFAVPGSKETLTEQRPSTNTQIPEVIESKETLEELAVVIENRTSRLLRISVEPPVKKLFVSK